jgi:hypothetical protein
MTDPLTEREPRNFLRVGLIIGGGAVLGCCLVGLALTLFLPMVNGMRGTARNVEAQNNLRQIVLALRDYHKIHNELPPAVVYDHQGKPLYSWRALLLPHLEGGALAREFHYDEAWDSPHNSGLLRRMPRVFRHPGVSTNDPSLTWFRVFDGPGAAFESDASAGFRPIEVDGHALQRRPPQITLDDQGIPDGLENTFLVVESEGPVPWSKPEDLTYGPKQPLPRLGGHFPHVFLAAFADGSARPIAQDTPDNILRAFVTRNGNDPGPAE